MQHQSKHTDNEMNNYPAFDNHHTCKVKKINNKKELDEVIGHITALQEAIEYEEQKIKEFWRQ
jgi:hypothetical protein